MKSNTIYIFIFSLLLLIASGALVFYVHTGISQKIEIVRNYYAKAEQEKSLQPITKLKTSLEKLSSQEIMIKNTFIPSTAVVEFITKLEALAVTNSLEISVQKIEYGASETLEEKYTIQPVSFALELQGGFNNINSFITQLISSEDALRVKEFKLLQNGIGKYSVRIIIEGKTLAI